MDPLILEDYQTPPYKMGFLNSQFEEVIPAQYDEVRGFNEGFAAINVKGLWGYIDSSGHMKISPRYLGAWSFSSGLGKVQSAHTRKLGFLTSKGDTVIPLEYDEAQSASHGLIPLKKQQYWGVKNADGKSVLPFDYYGIKIFSARYIARKVTQEWDIFDLKENQVIAKELNQVYSFTEQIFRAKNSENEYIYLDTSGRQIFKTSAILAYDPQQGVFTRCLAANQCRLFDIEGQPLSDTYDRLRPLNSNRFAFNKNEKWGLLDDLGSIILPSQFDQLYAFSEGYAPYLKNDLWGFIDRQGQQAVPNIYGLAWPFENEYARVLGRSGMAFLDTDLQKIPLPPKISEVRSFNEGMAAFKTARD